MAQTYEKPPTMLSHGELPDPAGTLVEDTMHERTGELVGVIEERTKEGRKLISQTAYLRPKGVAWNGKRLWPVSSSSRAARRTHEARGPRHLRRRDRLRGRVAHRQGDVHRSGPMGGLAIVVTWEEGGTARFPAGDELLSGEPDST